MALAFLALSLLLSGCGNNFGFPGVYRINVEQGNIVTSDMIEQLQPGMTRRQVRFILGTPLIEDTFHPDRWDYRYILRNGINTLEGNRLTVFFEGDELVNVVGAEVPAWAQPDGNS
jgi:outer membrane protein assembly factor BamE